MEAPVRNVTLLLVFVCAGLAPSAGASLSLDYEVSPESGFAQSYTYTNSSYSSDGAIALTSFAVAGTPTAFSLDLAVSGGFVTDDAPNITYTIQLLGVTGSGGWIQCFEVWFPNGGSPERATWGTFSECEPNADPAGGTVAIALAQGGKAVSFQFSPTFLLPTDEEAFALASDSHTRTTVSIGYDLPQGGCGGDTCVGGSGPGPSHSNGVPPWLYDWVLTFWGKVTAAVTGVVILSAAIFFHFYKPPPKTSDTDAGSVRG